jgi:glycyl-tRNA synthetase
MEKIISLCKRRGFIFPGSEIYGGLANSWDYGPLGVELRNNIKQLWWKTFVQQRDDVVGLESAIIMNSKVWQASGHLKHFTDPLVDCKKCKNRFRADQLKENACPDCGGELTAVRQFNMMLKTHLGPVENTGSEVYLRPETAQGMFVDFKTIANLTRKKLPFGIAQIGKAFRNEITPGNFIYRTREFEQMEIEYFIEDKDWQKYFEQWLGEMKKWLGLIGVQEKDVIYHEIPDGERAHYSKRTIDIEYKYPFGVNELYGLAYRGDYDLKNHHLDLDGKTPHVIEPTWGVDRTILAVLLSAYHEEKVKDEARVVLKLPDVLAPYKVAVLPLSKKEELCPMAEKIAADLRKKWMIDYDITQSIGKRYRRQDEIGTPYCVTVDFDSLNDQAVTVRERDTMKQDRIKITELDNYLEKKLNG